MKRREEQQVAAGGRTLMSEGQLIQSWSTVAARCLMVQWLLEAPTVTVCVWGGDPSSASSGGVLSSSYSNNSLRKTRK